MRRAAAVLAWVLIASGSGCAVSVPPLDAARSVAAALSSSGAPALEQDPIFAWILDLNGFEEIVYAASAGDGRVIFSNARGTRLLYDGVDIVSGRRLATAVRGFTVEKAQGGDGERVHDVHGLGTFRMTCEPTQVMENGLETRCAYLWPSTGETHPVVHRRLDDSDGLLRRLELTLVPGASPLVLERLRDHVDPTVFDELRDRVHARR